MAERKTQRWPKVLTGTRSVRREAQLWPDMPRAKRSRFTDEQRDELLRKVDVVLESEYGPLFAAIVDLIYKHCTPAERSTP